MKLVPFQFESREIRVITDENGGTLFVGKDVCEALGYADATTAMRSHCKGVQKLHPLQTPGGLQNVRVLIEADVLRLIVSSTLPAAQSFERLVFEEILPTIRRTGAYGAVDPLAGLPPEHRALITLMCEQAAIKAMQVEHAKVQAAHHDAILRIEANQIAAVASVQCFTALGYSIFRETPMSKIELIRLGKAASAISKKRGIAVDKVADGRHGRVGSYHVTALDEAFEEISK